MMTLSSMPFCPSDDYQTGLSYLPARWRDMTHPRVQHCHGRALLSRRLRALICRLDRATIRGLVIDDDRGARVELVAYLCDFGRERNLVETIVGPFARDERFDDAAQGVGTQHAVRNHHRRDASWLWTGPPPSRSRRYRHGSRGEMDPR